MKPVFVTLASLALATVLSTATYNSTLSGSQTAAETGKIALNLTTSGDLPGTTEVTLERDGSNIVSGIWRMTVLPRNASASSSERGELVGAITGGTLSLNAEGRVASVTSVTIVLHGGTGEFSNVTTGHGTMTVSSNAKNARQLSGTIVLNF